MNFGYNNWMVNMLHDARIEAANIQHAYEESVDAIQLLFVLFGTTFFVISVLSCLTLECKACPCTTAYTMFLLLIAAITILFSTGILVFKHVSYDDIDKFCAEDFENMVYDYGVDFENSIYKSTSID